MTTTPSTTKTADAKMPAAEAKAALAAVNAFAAEATTDSIATITSLLAKVEDARVAMVKLADDWHAARVAMNSTAKRASAGKVHTTLSAAGKLEAPAAMVAFLLALPAASDDRDAVKLQYQKRCASSKPRRLPTWAGFMAHVNEAASFAAKYPGHTRFTAGGDDTAKFTAVKLAAEAVAEAKATTKVTKKNVVREVAAAHANDPARYALEVGRMLHDVNVAFTAAMAALATDADRTAVKLKLRKQIEAAVTLAEQEAADAAASGDDADDDADDVVPGDDADADADDEVAA